MGLAVLGKMALGGIGFGAAGGGNQTPPPPPPHSEQMAGQAAHAAELDKQSKGSQAAAAVPGTSTKNNDMGNMSSGKEMGFA